MNDTDREEQLGQIIAGFLKASAQGENPDRAALLAAHPQFADELRSFCANHDQMQADAGIALTSAGMRDTADPPLFAATIAPHTGRPAPQLVGYFGDYELLAEVARGGMGVVYKARQVNLNRIVALKMILTGQLATPDDVRRFYQEAESAAKLEHPGIVPIFEVGQHKGQHFFSMGFVDGPNLAQVIAEGPLSAKDAATIVRLVAEAISFAHDRGVIHRDLKPANVLLAKPDDATRAVHLTAQPGRVIHSGTYQPKVTDFGLAKRTGSGEEGLTVTGQILGTPSYMPPEQASGRNLDVGAASDVYSLGAILYAALTGHPPFQSDSAVHIVMQVLEREPVPPRQLNPAIPKDLETICLKCLEKDRRKRYATASNLAAELQRFLSGEPIHARRISGIERSWRWCRRNPVHAGFWALCLLVLLALGIGGPILAVQQWEVAHNETQLREQTADALQEAKKERDEAQRQRTIANREQQLAQRRLAEGQVALGKSALQNNRTAEALNWFLHAYLNAPPGDPMRVGARNVIGAHLDEIPQTLVHPATVHEAAVSPDGKTLWAAYLASRSQLWDLATGKPIGKSLPHSGDVVSGTFSPDGTSLLTGDWGGATVYNAATGKPLFPELAHENREDTMIAPEFSPDGLTIATRDTLESVRLWDAKTGKPRSPSLPHQGEVWRIRFSPDSKLLAAQSGDEVRIWDAGTGAAVGKPWTVLSDFAFHPDGRTMAVCGKDGKVSLRGIRDASTVVELAHDEPITRLQFDAAGQNLLGSFFSYQAAPTQAAVLWRNVAGEDRSKLVLRQGTGLGSAALSPSGAFVALVERGQLRVVQTRDGRSLWTQSPRAASATEASGSFGEIEFSSDSQTLLARGNSVAFVFSMNQGRLLAREENLRCSEFSPDGKRVVFGGAFGWARVRSVEAVASRPVATLEDLKKTRGIQHTAFTSDGRRVVTAGRGKQVQFWDAATWQPQGEPIVCEWPIEYMALSPDDKQIALLLTLPKPPMAALFSPTPGRFELWDVAARTRIGQPIDFPTGVSRVVFDEAGKTIAINSVLYDVETQQPKRVEPESDEQTPAVVKLLHWKGSFHRKIWDEVANAPAWVRLPAKGLLYPKLTANGGLLAQDKKGQIRLWDAATGQALGPLFPIDGAPAFFSDSGRYILGGQHDAVQIWDTYTGKRCGEQLIDSHVQMAAAFSPTESVLATYEGFYTRLWDCATGIMLGPPLQNTSTGENDLDFSRDGRWLLSTDGRVHVFRVPQPAIDDPQRLRLLVEIRTGLHIDENGTIQNLTHRQWLDRQAKWDELGADRRNTSGNGSRD